MLVTEYRCSRRSIEYRRQVRSCRLLIHPESHQRHRVLHAQSVFEAPPEQRRVAGGDQDSGSGEIIGRRNQGLDVEIGFPHGMPEKTQNRRVAGDASGAFDYFRGALRNGIGKLAAAIMAMDFAAQAIAGFQIGGQRRTYMESFYRLSVSAVRTWLKSALGYRSRVSYIAIGSGCERRPGADELRRICAPGA